VLRSSKEDFESTIKKDTVPLTKKDLEALNKASMSSAEYRDILGYLKDTGTAYPSIRLDPQTEQSLYHPASNTIVLGLPAYEQAVNRKKPSTGVIHEMTHATQDPLTEQYAQATRWFADKPTDPEARRLFVQAYEKLRKDKAELARKLDPKWEKSERAYRSSPVELEAFGVGNVQGNAVRRGPLHLDPTMATEAMILLDLARRDARRNPIKKEDGGEVSTEEFIKKNVPRGTSEVPQLDPEGRLIDEREDIRSESQRMLNRLQSQPSKLPPGIRRTVAATRAQGKESMFPAAAPARDLLSGILGASPTAPGSEAYRTGQAIANMPPVQAAAAIPAKVAASAGDAATALAAMGPAMGGVVKRKGGNWLANAISDEMQNLKLLRFGNDPVGTYEDMKNVYTPEVMSRLSPETLQQVKEGFAALKPQVAINKWIDTKLSKYIQNEFATPEDPVRALVERGISPARNPGDINPFYDATDLFEKRREAGFPAEGLARTEAGRNWEDMADSSVNVSYLKNLLSSLKEGQESKYGIVRVEANRTLRDNPWLNKLTLPYTPIYGALGPNYRPVFTHVIDELQNAMATNSGLPKNLQLDPDDLSKMNVPQVVELVDKINKWRVENVKNLQLEETLKADLYKAYPEQKYRWVQLNRPGQFAAESDAMGHSVRGYEPRDKGGSDYYGLGGFKAIESGEARVYSLRDEKGQPHVTIEVSAAPGAMTPSEFYHSDLATQSLFDRLDKVDEATINKDESSWWEKVVRESPEYQEYIKAIPAKITQIKGKGNEAPAKKYWAFAQDFVKSSNWSDVQDLKNIGLRKTSSVFNERDIAKLKDMGEEVPNYVSGRDILRLQDLVIPEGKRLKYDDAGHIIGYQDERLGFNKGGPVHMQDGGEATVEEFIKKNMPRGVSSLKGYGEGENAADMRRSAREALRGLIGLEPFDPTNPSEAYRIASTPTPLAALGIFGRRGLGIIDAAKASKAFKGRGLDVAEPERFLGKELMDRLKEQGLDVERTWLRGKKDTSHGFKYSPKYDYLEALYEYQKQPDAVERALKEAKTGRPWSYSGTLSRQPGDRDVTKYNTKGGVWLTENPTIAESYSGDKGFIIPVLTRKPEVVLDAKGEQWDEFFKTSKEFKEAQRDPNVKSVEVKNIIDFGGRSKLPSGLSDDELRELLTANNLFLKKPFVDQDVVSKLTGEPFPFQDGGPVNVPRGTSTSKKQLDTLKRASPRNKA
jgi:hypothetical protein